MLKLCVPTEIVRVVAGNSIDSLHLHLGIANQPFKPVYWNPSIVDAALGSNCARVARLVDDPVSVLNPKKLGKTSIDPGQIFAEVFLF